MKYKKIITSGCSFSEANTPWVWPLQLETYIKKLNDSVKFDHRGMGSQGQELIQKKAVHAIEQALDEGYKPEELCMFVMWTSNDRKSFYVDNPDFIKTLADNWAKSKQGWQYQLANLNNELEDEAVIVTKGAVNNRVPYNKKGGWLITSCHVADDIQMMRDYFMMSLHGNSLAATHLSLENIIFLQTYCKAKNIKLYQQVTIPYTFEDFETHKDHQIIKYLYKQLDHNTFISKQSIYEYLINNPEYFKDYPTDVHPNGLGHRIWLNEVMLPHLEDDGFFL